MCNKQGLLPIQVAQKYSRTKICENLKTLEAQRKNHLVQPMSHVSDGVPDGTSHTANVFVLPTKPVRTGKRSHTDAVLTKRGDDMLDKLSIEIPKTGPPHQGKNGGSWQEQMVTSPEGRLHDMSQDITDNMSPADSPGYQTSSVRCISKRSSIEVLPYNLLNTPNSTQELSAVRRDFSNVKASSEPPHAFGSDHTHVPTPRAEAMADQETVQHHRGVELNLGTNWDRCDELEDLTFGDFGLSDIQTGKTILYMVYSIEMSLFQYHCNWCIHKFLSDCPISPNLFYASGKLLRDETAMGKTMSLNDYHHSALFLTL